MPTPTTRPANDTLPGGSRVYLRPPRTRDAAAFLAAVAHSRALHRGWVAPPATPERYARFVARFAGARSRDPLSATHYALLAWREEDDALLGVFSIGDIVRGGLQGGYLGYYAFAPHHGAGYMSEAIRRVLDVAFRRLRLHRVEVNIQPSNTQSLALAARAGFTREGYSRRYVKVAGRWRDHERWAILVEDWRLQRARRR